MEDKKYIGISDNKLHHILGVARRCYEIAKERGYSEILARRMFMIGWNHDVGYEFSENYAEHPVISDELIKTFSRYGSYEIRNHGKIDLDNMPMDLVILNIADLTVDSKGNICTVEERLSDIADRLGENSLEYSNAKKLAEKVGLLEPSEKLLEHTILLDDNIERNENGVNLKIKSTVLSDKEMREIGFTDHCKDRWYFCRSIKFPNNKQYRGFDVSFSVTISKDNSQLRIDVLDEAFCQPYDYQSMIMRSRELKIEANRTAMIIFEQVEEHMKYLQDKGVLHGHIYGEYI